MSKNKSDFRAGLLYIVATPIGNLGDISFRALETLKAVDVILCEDTRQGQKLLNHFSINNKTIAFHQHNERESTLSILQQCQNGASVALISDAGTPLINDPGWHLVQAAQNMGIRVIPIPGCSAFLAALSVSGLPTDRFCFQGFLSSKKSARREELSQLSLDSRTLVFYEAPHRIIETLKDMIFIFGEAREAMIARELTKLFETTYRATLGELLTWVENDPNQQRGEIVLVIAGAQNESFNQETVVARRILKILLTELPLTQAAQLTAKITKIPKRTLYELGLKIENRKE